MSIFRKFVNKDEKTTEKRLDNSWETKSECDLCNPFRESDAASTSEVSTYFLSLWFESNIHWKLALHFIEDE